MCCVVLLLCCVVLCCVLLAMRPTDARPIFGAVELERRIAVGNHVAQPGTKVRWEGTPHRNAPVRQHLIVPGTKCVQAREGPLVWKEVRLSSQVACGGMMLCGKCHMNSETYTRRPHWSVGSNPRGLLPTDKPTNDPAVNNPSMLARGPMSPPGPHDTGRVQAVFIWPTAVASHRGDV